MQGGPELHLELHARSLLTGAKHPHSSHPTVKLRFSADEDLILRWTYEIQIHGDYVGILAGHIFFCVWDWRTGAVKMVRATALFKTSLTIFPEN